MKVSERSVGQRQARHYEQAGTYRQVVVVKSSSAPRFYHRSLCGSQGVGEGCCGSKEMSVRGGFNRRVLPAIDSGKTTGQHPIPA